MAQKSKSRARREIAGVHVPKPLEGTAKGILANPLAREFIAAALVHVAAMLIESQAAKGSTTRRLVSGLGDAGKRAGKFGSATIDEALGTLRDYWSKPGSNDALPKQRQERSRRPRQSQRRKKTGESIAPGGANKSPTRDELPLIP